MALIEDGVRELRPTLVIRNEVSELRHMTEWLRTHAHGMHLPDKLAFDFDLCANEAVANIISYGYPEGGVHEIELRFFRNGDSLCLEIEDDGIPFDPTAAPLPHQPECLARAPIGGLGIGLIRKTMHECRYARRDGHNVLQLIAHVGR